MPYSDPQSTHNPTTGQIIPASWGDIVRDDLEYLARNFPHCSVYSNTVQSVANSTPVDLNANTERSDIGGMHSTAINTARVTIPASEGGFYECSAVVQFAASAAGYRVVTFRVNGGTDYDAAVIYPVQTGGVQTTISCYRALSLAAGDFVTVYVFQNSGGSLDVTLLDFTVKWTAVA